jgi:hypothetical protein
MIKTGYCENSIVTCKDGSQWWAVDFFFVKYGEVFDPEMMQVSSPLLKLERRICRFVYNGSYSVFRFKNLPIKAKLKEGLGKKVLDFLTSLHCYHPCRIQFYSYDACGTKKAVSQWHCSKGTSQPLPPQLKKAVIKFGLDT